MAAKHSAGILLYRLRAGAPEFLLVHPGGPFWAKRDLGAWTIPKGEIEEGEDARDCALRELGEELGAAPRLEAEALIDLGEVRQKSGKVVEAWAAEGEFDPGRAEQQHVRDRVAAAQRRASASSPRSTGPSGSTPRRRDRRSSPPRTLLDRLLEHLG